MCELAGDPCSLVKKLHCQNVSYHEQPGEDESPMSHFAGVFIGQDCLRESV